MSCQESNLPLPTEVKKKYRLMDRRVAIISHRGKMVGLIRNRGTSNKKDLEIKWETRLTDREKARIASAVLIFLVQGRGDTRLVTVDQAEAAVAEGGGGKVNARNKPVKVRSNKRRRNSVKQVTTKRRKRL